MSGTIRAVHLVRYGDPLDGLALATQADPGPPGPGEALIAVEYAPVNVNDLMVVRGVYAWRPEPPIAIGNEGAGIVLAVGRDVTGVRAGDRVVLPFMVRSWRHKLLAPADQLVVVPPDADPQQAAMLAINAVTAAMLLDDYVPLARGDAVIFNAATSGLGRWLAALAERRELRAIGLVRRPEDVAAVRQACPELEVVADQEDVASVRRRFEGWPMRLALDGVGGAASARLAHLLSRGGTLVTYGAASREPMALPSGDLIFRGIRVQGFWEGHPDKAARVVSVLRGLVGMIGPGGVRQPVAAVYPLDRLRDAVEHARRGGKVLLSFRD